MGGGVALFHFILNIMKCVGTLVGNETRHLGLKYTWSHNLWWDSCKTLLIKRICAVIYIKMLMLMELRYVQSKMCSEFSFFYCQQILQQKIINCKEQCLKNFIYPGGKEIITISSHPFLISIFALLASLMKSQILFHTIGVKCVQTILLSI